ncbi:MAG: hypothetical protein IMZ66_02825 [Planctomycetes bacterium]|nr:hypothetical protein [Planctomycetota bacterium]
MMLGPDSEQMQAKKEFLDNLTMLGQDSQEMKEFLDNVDNYVSPEARLAAIRMAQGAARLRTERVIPFIASGGVTTVEDIRALRAARVDGAIIGRALYEGTLTLEAALEAAGAQAEA